MSETYTGVVAELGGPELGKTGNEKPRKVILKKDPADKYGKTFRCWSNEDSWFTLESLGIGKTVTVDYELEQPNYTLPDGSAPKPTNKIVGVSEGSDGGGSATPNGGSSGTTPPAAAGTPPPSDTSWGEMPKDTWSSPPPNRKDETTRQIEAAWSITNAIALLGDGAQDQDQVHTVAHQLLVMKHRIAQEIE